MFMPEPLLALVVAYYTDGNPVRRAVSGDRVVYERVMTRLAFMHSQALHIQQNITAEAAFHRMITHVPRTARPNLTGAGGGRAGKSGRR